MHPESRAACARDSIHMTDHTTHDDDKDRDDAARAEHGYRNEVSWDGGKGRQPYANQGDEEKGPPNGWPEVEGGDRGDASGRTLEQLEEVRKKP